LEHVLWSHVGTKRGERSPLAGRRTLGLMRSRRDERTKDRKGALQ